MLGTYLNTFVVNFHNDRKVVARVLNYDIHFEKFDILEYLFRDIFLARNYYFFSESETPVIFDCGSNIGMSVIYFKWLYPNCQIEAFEPSDEAFALLETNIKQNDLKDVVLHNAAVTKVGDSVDLFYDAQTATHLRMSTVRDRFPKQSKKVAAVQLSEFVNKKVDMLKLDIEGAESDVLEELAGAGKLPLIRHLTLEYHHHIRLAEDRLSSVLRILEQNSFGYHISTKPCSPSRHPIFQDIMIFAYNKNDAH